MDNETTTLQHLGIIADGNRRWAKQHNLPSIEGHKKGLQTIETLVSAASHCGIPYITFYVFSTENWGRTKEEVSYIMELAASRILGFAKKMAKHNIKFLVLGSSNQVSPRLQKLIAQSEQLTANCTGLTACFCFNYGGEQEIADAAQAVHDAKEAFTPESLSKHLYHPEVPPCDMIVRTSGEQRISGFMLWRAAYAEFYFLKQYFPDLEAEDIPKILEEYQNRHRRFGK